MPTLIEKPAIIQAAGNKPKRIEEYVGRVNRLASLRRHLGDEEPFPPKGDGSETNAGHGSVSVARMVSPEGWVEPGQRPDFEEITIVLRGSLRVEHERGTLDVRAGQAIVAHPGEWVRYSSPEPGGAEYIAVCVPAFSMETVHRDE
jgi:mannose-6-phosphate isomerase-like protein (cupin superfamily)